MFMKLFVVWLLVSELESTKDECPEQCRCDIWNGGKRLKCVDKGLASIEIDAPKQTNAIDLSHNVIHYVEDYGFKDLHLERLQYINLSYNLIGHLSLRAFDGLTKLTYLDLSYNGLENLPHDIFSKNIKLHTLILTGNRFNNIKQEPLFHSSSLQDLYINRCLIPHLYEETFSELPGLKLIDLSDNLLIEVKGKYFGNNTELSRLNLLKNPLTCDDKSFKYYCLTNVIVCMSRCSEGMMEKIRVEGDEEKEVEDVYIPWVFDEELEDDKKVNVTRIKEECEEVSLIVPLVIAFVSGTVIGMCNIGLCWYIVWFSNEKRYSDENDDLISLKESSFEFHRFNNSL